MKLYYNNVLQFVRYMKIAVSSAGNFCSFIVVLNKVINTNKLCAVLFNSSLNKVLSQYNSLQLKFSAVFVRSLTLKLTRNAMSVFSFNYLFISTYK